MSLLNTIQAMVSTLSQVQIGKPTIKGSVRSTYNKTKQTRRKKTNKLSRKARRVNQLRGA